LAALNPQVLDEVTPELSALVPELGAQRWMLEKIMEKLATSQSHMDVVVSLRKEHEALMAVKKEQREASVEQEGELLEKVWPMSIHRNNGIIGQSFSRTEEIMVEGGAELHDTIVEGYDMPFDTPISAMLCVPIYTLAMEKEEILDQRKQRSSISRRRSSVTDLMSSIQKEHHAEEIKIADSQVDEAEKEIKSGKCIGVLQFMHTGNTGRYFSKHDLQLARAASTLLSNRQYMLRQQHLALRAEKTVSLVQDFAQIALPVRTRHLSWEGQLEAILEAGRKLLQVGLITLVKRDAEMGTLRMLGMSTGLDEGERDDLGMQVKEEEYNEDVGLTGHVVIMKERQSIAIQKHGSGLTEDNLKSVGQETQKAKSATEKLTEEKAKRAESFVGISSGQRVTGSGSVITKKDAKIAAEDLPDGYDAKFVSAFPIMYEGTRVEGVLFLADKILTDEKASLKLKVSNPDLYLS